MSLRIFALFAAAGLLLNGCASISDSINSINPFAGSGPKVAPLKPIVATAEARAQWSFNAGKSGDYTFTPAVVGNAVFVAANDGTVNKLEDG